MKFWFLLLFTAVGLSAQNGISLTPFCGFCGLAGAETVVSESGQFVVHASPAPMLHPRSLTNDFRLIDLSSDLAAVTAEKTRRIFLKELGAPSGFRDKIHVVLLDRVEPESPIGMISGLFADGFEYQMRVPGRIENEKLVRGYVNALLLELANRNSRRGAELPPWLVEGLTRQILNALAPAFVGNQKQLMIERRGLDRLLPAREFFQTNSCMTIGELSFFSYPSASALELQRFEYSSHLFVHELLRLPNGGSLLTSFLQQLPGVLNWQTAFYQTYAQHFQRPLDLEKWWMLTWVEFQNKREKQTWPADLSLARLEALLMTELEVRTHTNDLPTRKQATLQEVIRETGIGAQRQVLAQKMQQLFFLSYNLAPEVVPLALDYQNAIKTYLDARAAEVQPTLKMDPAVRREQVLKSTVRAFDDLDARRAALLEDHAMEAAAPARLNQQASR